MRPSKSERMRILVTGASGLYGGYFSKYAMSKGHEVFSVRHSDRPITTATALGIDDKITWARGDICDVNFLSLLLAEHDIQAVAHFAAKPIVRTGTIVAKPIYDINIGGTVALLDAVKQVAARRKILFLMVSTDKAYGDAGDRPYTENMPLNGTSIYETSKIGAEVACRGYFTHGFVPDLVISRSCNVVGVDFHWRLVGNTVRQLLSGEPAKKYTDNQYVREYLDAESAVEAQYQLLMRADEYRGQSFNIGSGEVFTQEEMIDLIIADHFPGGPVIRIPSPPAHMIEIAYQRMDCTRIQGALGWKPRRSVRAAIADVVAWWREHRALAPWSQL